MKRAILGALATLGSPALLLACSSARSTATASADAATGRDGAARDAALRVDSGMDAGSRDAARDAAKPPPCNGATVIPPLITVTTSPSTGQCDPTFTLLSAPGSASPPADASAGAVRCPTQLSGCPTTPTGGAFTCEFILTGLSGGPYTVEVTEPGFSMAVIPDVSTGLGGCATSPASRDNVVLSSDTFNDGGPLGNDAGDAGDASAEAGYDSGGY